MDTGELRVGVGRGSPWGPPEGRQHLSHNCRTQASWGQLARRGPALSPQDKESPAGEGPAPTCPYPSGYSLSQPAGGVPQASLCLRVLCVGYVFHRGSVSHFSGHRVGLGRGTGGWFQYLLFFFSLYNGAKRSRGLKEPPDAGGAGFIGHPVPWASVSVINSGLRLLPVWSGAQQLWVCVATGPGQVAQTDSPLPPERSSMGW